MKREDRSILLVEDDPNDVLLLRRAFRDVTGSLDTVVDGDEAIEYLTATGRHADRDRTDWPELILLDLKLPRRSGQEVLRWIRWEAGVTDVPVVVLTSSGESRDVRRAYELGANSYLRKPASFDELRELARTLDLYWLDLNHPGPRA